MLSYVIAIVADIAGFIPGINVVSDIIAASVLGYVAPMEGLDLYSKGFGMTALTIFLEMIPGVSMLPLWTIRVWRAHRRKEKQNTA